MQNKVIFPLVVLVSSLILVWFIINNKPQAQKSRQSNKQKLRTLVIEPINQTYTVKVPSYGVVQPKTQSLMIAQVSGQIVQLTDQFRDGAFFEKGDLLLIIDDADYQAQLTIAKAELKQAEFTYADEQARSKQAIKNWYDLGNKNTPPPLVARELQLNSSKSNLEASRAKVLQAELNLKRTKIVAPFAGRVLDLNVNVGQVVNIGNTLGSIYAVDSAEIRLALKQNQLQHLDLPESYRDSQQSIDNKTLSAEFYINIGEQKHHWDAQITRVEGTIDTQTRQLYVVAEVDNPYAFKADGRPPLKIGQFVNATITGKQLTNVIIIPKSAVYSGNYINVINSGVIQRKYISPLWQDDNHTIVEDTFEPGQSIAITPLGDVISGTLVEAVPTTINTTNNKDAS